MSFFEEDEEPARRPPRPRRAAPAAGPGVDPQTLWMRRGVAIGIGLLAFLALVVLVNACQDSRRKNSLRTYNREASALVQQSNADVGSQFFDTMSQAASQSPEDLQTQISSLRVQSEKLLERGETLDTPGQMTVAQQSLLIALEMRRDGLDYIAERITTALGDEGDVADEAIESIAGQMQSFLASDVLVQARVTPVVREALKDNEVVADPVSNGEGFLPGYDWLDAAYVADQLGTRLSEGGRNRDADEPPAPGLHGNGLESVAVGDTTLQPDPASNRVSAADATFTVTFANQGENDEFDVPVEVTLQGPGKPIKARKTVDMIAQGESATVNIPLPKPPTAGEVYTVTVNVKPVPGEKKTDNNRQTYNVLFTA